MGVSLMTRSKILEVIILSLLSERTAHAYDLLKTLRIRQGKWRLQTNVGAVYRAVERLAAQGLIVAAGSDREGNRPERTNYRITEAGKDALVERVGELLSVEQPPFDTFRLGLTFVDDLEKETATELLERRLHWLGSRRDEVQEVLTFLTGQQLPRRFFVVAELDLAQVDLEISWLETLVNDIKTNRLSWDEPVPPQFRPFERNDQ